MPPSAELNTEVELRPRKDTRIGLKPVDRPLLLCVGLCPSDRFDKTAAVKNCREPSGPRSAFMVTVDSTRTTEVVPEVDSACAASAGHHESVNARSIATSL
jgi:hypothetical protein